MPNGDIYPPKYRGKTHNIGGKLLLLRVFRGRDEDKISVSVTATLTQHKPTIEEGISVDVLKEGQETVLHLYHMIAHNPRCWEIL